MYLAAGNRKLNQCSFNKQGLFFSHDKPRYRYFLGFIQLLSSAIRDPGRLFCTFCSALLNVLSFILMLVASWLQNGCCYGCRHHVHLRRGGCEMVVPAIVLSFIGIAKVSSARPSTLALNYKWRLTASRGCSGFKESSGVWVVSWHIKVLNKVLTGNTGNGSWWGDWRPVINLSYIAHESFAIKHQIGKWMSLLWKWKTITILMSCQFHSRNEKTGNAGALPISMCLVVDCTDEGCW